MGRSRRGSFFATESAEDAKSEKVVGWRGALAEIRGRRASVARRLGGDASPYLFRSLVAEGDQRVDLGGAAGGEVAGSEAGEGDDEGDEGEDGGVLGADAF